MFVCHVYVCIRMYVYALVCMYVCIVLYVRGIHCGALGKGLFGKQRVRLKKTTGRRVPAPAPSTTVSMHIRVHACVHACPICMAACLLCLYSVCRVRARS